MKDFLKVKRVDDEATIYINPMHVSCITSDDVGEECWVELVGLPGPIHIVGSAEHIKKDALKLMATVGPGL